MWRFVVDSPYDALAYDDRPVAETHPDRLFVAARRAGLALAAPERVRVLELGCAHGINLIPMAYHLPGASFVGVDLSATQIERGRGWVAALGLTNLELDCADITALDLGDARFDIIIAHGLVSWVPDAVRDRALRICRDHLDPSGVAYVSYNAMPAWGVRGAIKRALLIGTAGITAPRDRLARARQVLATLGTTQPLEGTAEGAWIAGELEALRDKSDAYLLHEYLVEHGRAYYLGEMVQHAARHGLSFLDDVADSDVPPGVAASTRAAIRGLSDDPIAREELADILELRQFRASLFCRADAPRDASLAMAELHASAERGGTDDDPPPTRALLDRLARAWPGDRTVPSLAEATGQSLAEVVATVDALERAGRLQLRPRALGIAEPTERPAVAALTRFEAAQHGFVTTPRHACAPLDAFHVALLAHADGTRTRDELGEALAADIEAGRLTPAGPLPPRDRLLAALAPLVSAAVGRIGAAGLLVAPSAAG